MIEYLIRNVNMEKVTKEKLKEIANRQMFDMSEEEYNTLLADFDILTKQFSLIDDALISDNSKVNK